ncbi:MAG: hypothetical protein IJU18_02750, partial [Oscillospiraceae bacterium]|nr:hypothetical protein [Oscillospiraceae bacterium]
RTLQQQVLSLQQQLGQLAAVVDDVKETHLTELLPQESGTTEQAPASPDAGAAPRPVERQRQRTREAVRPR